VYGPVRTVVWQGSAGDRRPYADLVGYTRKCQLSATPQTRLQAEREVRGRQAKAAAA